MGSSSSSSKKRNEDEVDSHGNAMPRIFKILPSLSTPSAHCWSPYAQRTGDSSNIIQFFPLNDVIFNSALRAPPGVAPDFLFDPDLAQDAVISNNTGDYIFSIPIQWNPLFPLLP